ncbi:MAG TPA: hypothetical protein ENH82_09645 [bacterium]|nr:hypothetical protein [bacterium]
MKTHTPGQWHVDKIYHNGQECSLAVHPCHFYFTGTIKNLNRADAKLIAASPELLEACNEALTWWHSIPSHFNEKEPIWLEMVRKAIAKAE